MNSKTKNIGMSEFIQYLEELLENVEQERWSLIDSPRNKDYEEGFASGTQHLLIYVIDKLKHL